MSDELSELVHMRSTRSSLSLATTLLLLLSLAVTVTRTTASLGVWLLVDGWCWGCECQAILYFHSVPR